MSLFNEFETELIKVFRIHEILKDYIKHFKYNDYFKNFLYFTDIFIIF